MAKLSSKIPFVHLHNHFESSLNDSLLRVETGVTRAAELGMSAFAMTDHDCLHSLPAYLDALSASQSQTHRRDRVLLCGQDGGL